MRYPHQLLLLSLMSTIAYSSYAENATPPSIVVAPTCLLKNINHDFKTLAVSKTLNLIETNEKGIDELIAAKNNQEKICGGFMDVTYIWKKHKDFYKTPNAFLAQYEIKSQKKLTNTYTINYSKTVNELINDINPTNIWSNLEKFSSRPDRYSRSKNGVAAANEVKTHIEEMVKSSGRHDVTTYFVSTYNYKQPSLVVKIGNSKEPAVVIGAHIDTLRSNVSENKPGADDDGSGSMSTLEAARTIMHSGIEFKRPIYFVFYAAEEVGLVGSQRVVHDFKRKKIPVAAAIQFDMTGYANNNDPTMWLLDDYVNQELTTYIESLITYYIKTPVKHTACGYACSDHASWTQAGYPAAAPFEAGFNSDNPYIHTGSDTIEKLSLSHMTHFASLAVAFAVELAEPIQ